MAAQGVVNAEAAAAAEATPSISGLGASGGLRPSADKMIYQNVLGDPRTKVLTFTFNGVQYTFLFRLGIANVKVLDIKKRRFGLEPRTRVMATVLEGDVRTGGSYVFDINVNPQKLRNSFTRWDYYDYDFDVQYLPATREFALT